MTSFSDLWEPQRRSATFFAKRQVKKIVRDNSPELKRTLICNSETAQQIDQALHQGEDSSEVTVTSHKPPNDDTEIVEIVNASQ